MTKENREQANITSDRRDPIHEGTSLSGSTKRNNDVTEKALHPAGQQHTQISDQLPRVGEPREHHEGPVIDEKVDQSPGERQKENQNQSKDDPLAA